MFDALHEMYCSYCGWFVKNATSLMLMKTDGVAALLGLNGDHIQVLFGYFWYAVLIPSCEKLITEAKCDQISFRNISEKFKCIYLTLQYAFKMPNKDLQQCQQFLKKLAILLWLLNKNDMQCKYVGTRSYLIFPNDSLMASD